MRLLLHTCCASCAIYPVAESKKDGFQVTGFFYNPNIHPAGEYAKRREGARGYFQRTGLPALFPEHNSTDYFESVPAERSVQDRCSFCWGRRLEETASFAKKNGFDAFTSTLLASPYQDHDILLAICRTVAETESIKFYYKDFRVGFKEAHKLARKEGIYCQNYCGCVFSMVEREERKRDRKKAKRTSSSVIPGPACAGLNSSGNLLTLSFP
ncbi:MAG: epoxyqueuosine reductase QueH [Candidatus Omnitrophota bacterium]